MHLINTKVQAKKVFWQVVLLHSYLCNASKSKATNVFPKHILKSKEHDQSIHARKKMFCRVIVQNYLCNILCKSLIKMETRGGTKSKNRHPSWLYSTEVGLPEAAIEDAQWKSRSYKFRNIDRKMPLLGFLFNKVEGRQVCNFFKNRLQHRCLLYIWNF